MGYCRYKVGSNYWKVRAADLHILGLCIRCGKVPPETVQDLYCKVCKTKRKN